MGVAVIVTLPVVEPKVPVAVVPLPEMLIIELSLLVQVEDVLALKVTLVVELRLTVLPEHPDVQVTTFVLCPTVTGTEPLIVLSVAVMVTALLVLATLAVIFPLLLVLSTATCVSSPELQSTELVKVLLLPSSKFPVATN